MATKEDPYGYAALGQSGEKDLYEERFVASELHIYRDPTTEMAHYLASKGCDPLARQRALDNVLDTHSGGPDGGASFDKWQATHKGTDGKYHHTDSDIKLIENLVKGMTTELNDQLKAIYENELKHGVKTNPPLQLDKLSWEELAKALEGNGYRFYVVDGQVYVDHIPKEERAQIADRTVTDSHPVDKQQRDEANAKRVAEGKKPVDTTQRRDGAIFHTGVDQSYADDRDNPNAPATPQKEAAERNPMEQYAAMAGPLFQNPAPIVHRDTPDAPGGPRGGAPREVC
jgi:hypothetical protein